MGGSQSPVDLVGALQVPGLESLQLNYQPSKVVLTNNGHTLQVNYDKGSSLTFAGKRFELVQYHFHTPSEHTLEGRSYPLELHLVHQATDKSLAVVGVLIAEGAPHSALLKFWNRLPKTPSEVDTGTSISARDLLPRSTDDYYTYPGSLTTPPCSENVTWIVLRHQVEASKAQIAAFREVFPMNARPTSLLGARILLAS
jgi:carbonic anhydrase